MNARVTTVAAAVAFLVLAAVASAAPTWLPPAQLSPNDGGPDVFGARLAMNATGHAIVAWNRAGNVQALGRRAGSAAWQAPVDLSAGTLSDVGMDASGRAVVAYTRGGFPGSVAQAVYRPGPDAAWGRAGRSRRHSGRFAKPSC